MKILGYIDDFLSWWFGWQFSLPLKFMIPLSIMELIVVGVIISRLRYRSY